MPSSESALNSRLSSLQEIVDHFKNVSTKDKVKLEIFKYIPIGIVACIEGYFRWAIKALIDLGSPYSENVHDLAKSRDIKFDLTIVQAIQGKNITLGDFVSHLLSTNKFKDVNANMSSIIKNDFFEKLKPILPKFREPYILEKYEQYLEKYKETENDLGYYHFIDNFVPDEKVIEETRNLVYEHLSKIFELRHIQCHELVGIQDVDASGIGDYFESAKTFLWATEYFVHKIVYPEDPRDSLTAKERLYDFYEAINRKLEEAYQQRLVEFDKEIVEERDYFARAFPDEPERKLVSEESKAKFITSQEHWIKYRAAKAESAAADYLGGSAYGQVLTVALYTITKRRLDELMSKSDVNISLEYPWEIGKPGFP